ncbi:hypothetical protein J3U42_00175 [Gilliamella sp. B2923]|uniref:hypothetical protein n=1 Tax=unclassified Gilliamella TaxID=2685620 RepID=UPI001C6A36F6|nr:MULTISPECIES: hypothetical protein [unclassified Gilliamella]MCX8616808.1 hypothetical protein [Gilliamella sp. B2923]QYN47562.1 hypothetical protein GYM74_10295 [Gilliamella sp. ESL0405]
MNKILITIIKFLAYAEFRIKRFYYNLIKTDLLASKPIFVGIPKLCFFDEIYSWLESRKVERREVA